MRFCLGGGGGERNTFVELQEGEGEPARVLDVSRSARNEEGRSSRADFSSFVSLVLSRSVAVLDFGV